MVDRLKARGLGEKKDKHNDHEDHEEHEGRKT
jgi:hypothetical protein